MYQQSYQEPRTSLLNKKQRGKERATGISVKKRVTYHEGHQFLLKPASDSYPNKINK